MKVELINQTHTANIYGVYEEGGKPIGTIETVLTGPNCGTYAYSLTGKYTRKQILGFYREEKKKEDLFNELFEHYGNENDTMKAVKIAIINNLTAKQVAKIY